MIMRELKAPDEVYVEFAWPNLYHMQLGFRINNLPRLLISS